MQSAPQPEGKSSKQPSYARRNLRRCLDALLIASYFLAKRKSMQEDAFMELIAPNVEKQLAVAGGAIQVITRSLERQRKNQPGIDLNEESSEVDDLVKTYTLLVEKMEKIMREKNRRTMSAQEVAQWFSALGKGNRLDRHGNEIDMLFEGDQVFVFNITTSELLVCFDLSGDVDAGELWAFLESRGVFVPGDV